ncbi:TonB-dependent receptor [Exilibacterium tricleocarpae]|uniref:TonB-dependent receptor n=1 Tax=Exilibacterium tricleocarpae TaxID=2591008 RepID=A0A545T1W9_9GAMM|nr:TonB-dependent receptor [Exilibacterium tricleocarpae]TQV71211.1 TonB-dependent receptor [Exilibacterium tricleocarpae]
MLRLKGKYRFVSAGLVLLSASGLTQAQGETAVPEDSTTVAGEDDGLLEEIEVTGTRIKRDAFNSPTPLIAIDKEDILDSGVNELSEVLTGRPGVTTAINTSESQNDVQTAGLSSVDLRALGANRTLTLIDGRRTVSNSVNGRRVSLSTIPDAFVDRIEIITGAASAVYGSDAIAGVINIITEDDLEGFRVGLRAGGAVTGGAEEKTLDLAFGTDFDDDRGYFLIAGEIDTDEALTARDVGRYAFEEIDLDYDDGVNEFDSGRVVDGLTGDLPASRFLPGGDLFGVIEPRDRSLGTFGGVFDSRRFFYDDNNNLITEQTDPNFSNARAFLNGRDGLNTRLFNIMTLPRERHNLSTKVKYAFTDHLEAFAQLSYSNVETVSRRLPEYAADGDDSIIIDRVTGEADFVIVDRIPETNPFIPIPNSERERSGSVIWDRRLLEVGFRENKAKRETLRFLAGIDGDALFGTDWEWHASLAYGRYEQENRRTNEINYNRLNFALDAEVDPADPDNPDRFRCADEAARAAGCVPLNPFGIGSISQAAADYVRANLTLEAVAEQISVVAYTTGDLFQLPAGAVGGAFGVEYREDSQKSKNDLESRFGGTSGPTVPNSNADIDVAEIFGEVSVPLLAGVTGAEYLGLDASVRAADYSLEGVGTIGTWSLGLTWRPIESLLVRAKQGTAVRAPDLSEAFSLPRGDFDDVRDICTGVTATSEGVVDENCRSVPGIREDIESDENEEGVFEGDGNTFSPNAGNPELSEETADTLTVGLSYEPFDWLAASVDFYDIEVEDVISEIENEEILRQCYEDAENFGPDNPRCADITRAPNGQLAQIIQRQFNLNKLELRGIDYGLRVRFDLQDWQVPGRFTLNVNHSRQLENRQLSTDVAGEEVVTEFLGEVGTPREQSFGSLTWRHNGLRLRWSIEYTGPVIDDHRRIEEYEELVAERLEEGGDEPERPLFLEFGSYIEHDFSVSYRTEISDIETRFYGGINNVFDRDPLFIPCCDVLSGSSRNYSGEYGSPRGRFLFVGVDMEF